MNTKNKSKRMYSVIILLLLIVLSIGTVVFAEESETQTPYSLIIRKVLSSGSPPEASNQQYKFRIEGYSLSDNTQKKIQRDVTITGEGEKTIYFGGPTMITVAEQTDKVDITNADGKYNMSTAKCESQMTVPAGTRSHTIGISKDNGQLKISRPDATVVTYFKVTGKSFQEDSSGNAQGEASQYSETFAIEPGKEHTLTNLSRGEYTIQELKAPEGYGILVGPREADVLPGEIGEFHINGNSGKLSITAPAGQGPDDIYYYSVIKSSGAGDFYSRIVAVKPGETYNLDNLPSGSYSVTEYIHSGSAGYTVKTPYTSEGSSKAYTFTIKKNDTFYYHQLPASSAAYYQVKIGNVSSPLPKGTQYKCQVKGNWYGRDGLLTLTYTLKVGSLHTLGSYFIPPEDNRLRIKVPTPDINSLKATLIPYYHKTNTEKCPYADIPYSQTVDDRGWMTISKAKSTGTGSDAESTVKYYYTVTDSTGQPITNFSATDENDNPITTFTDKDGTTLMLKAGQTVTLKGLAAGDYNIMETVQQDKAEAFHMAVVEDTKNTTSAGGEFDVIVLGDRDLTVSKPAATDDAGDGGRDYNFRIYSIDDSNQETEYKTITLKAGTSEKLRLPKGRYKVRAIDDQDHAFVLTFNDSSTVQVNHGRPAQITVTNTFTKEEGSYHVIHEYYLKTGDDSYQYEGSSLLSAVNGLPLDTTKYTSGDVGMEPLYNGQQYTYMDHGYGTVDAADSDTSDITRSIKEESDPEIDEDSDADTDTESDDEKDTKPEDDSDTDQDTSPDDESDTEQDTPPDDESDTEQDTSPDDSSDTDQNTSPDDSSDTNQDASPDNNPETSQEPSSDDKSEPSVQMPQNMLSKAAVHSVRHAQPHRTGSYRSSASSLIALSYTGTTLSANSASEPGDKTSPDSNVDPDGTTDNDGNTNPDDSADNDGNTNPDDSADNDDNTNPDDSADNDDNTNPDDSADNDGNTNPDDSADNDGNTNPDDSADNDDNTNPNGNTDNDGSTGPDSEPEQDEDSISDNNTDIGKDLTANQETERAERPGKASRRRSVTTNAYDSKGIISEGIGKDTDDNLRGYRPDTSMTEGVQATANGDHIIIIRYYREEIPVITTGSYKVIHVYYLRDKNGDTWEGTSDLRTVDVGQLDSENRKKTYTADNVVKEPEPKNFTVNGQHYTYTYDIPAYGKVAESDHKDDFTGEGNAGEGWVYTPDTKMREVYATEAGDQIIILRYYREVLPELPPTVSTGSYNVVHEYYYREKGEETDEGEDTVALTKNITVPLSISAPDSPAGPEAVLNATSNTSFKGTLIQNDAYDYTFEGMQQIESLSGPLESHYTKDNVTEKPVYTPDSGTQTNYTYYNVGYGYTTEDGYYECVIDKNRASATTEGKDIIILRYIREGGTPPKPENPDEPDLPTEPDDPDKPDKPDKPGKPDKPTNPDGSQSPDDGGRPVEKDNPGTNPEPPKPETPEQPKVTGSDDPHPTELPDPNDPNSPDTFTVWKDGVPQVYSKVWNAGLNKWEYLPEGNNTSANGAAVRTGDNNHTSLWMALTVGALGILYVSHSINRRRNKMKQGNEDQT